MRLVTWNAAWNTRKRAYEQVGQLVDVLRPDVLVATETCRAITVPPEYVWGGGDGPGISVHARGEYRVMPLDTVAEVPSHVVPVRIHGPVSFLLLAVWAKKDTGSYHDVLMRALAAYRGPITSDHTVLAGDLNSNTRVKAQVDTHPEFVEEAAKLGLVSAYHALGGHEHGREPESTYLRSAEHEHDAGFHLDYCFVSSELLPGARVQIGELGEWRALSDHLPIVIDVPDANFASRS